MSSPETPTMTVGPGIQFQPAAEKAERGLDQANAAAAPLPSGNRQPVVASRRRRKQ